MGGDFWNWIVNLVPFFPYKRGGGCGLGYWIVLYVHVLAFGTWDLSFMEGMIYRYNFFVTTSISYKLVNYLIPISG